MMKKKATLDAPMIPEANSERAHVQLPQQHHCRLMDADAIQAQKSIHKRRPPKKEQVDNNNDDDDSTSTTGTTITTVTAEARKRKMMNMPVHEARMERLRLLGANRCCSSSGSDHGPCTSIPLSALVHQFIEHDSSNNSNNKCTNSSSARITRSSSVNNNEATTAMPTALDLHKILLSDLESVKPWEDLIRSILDDPRLRLTQCKGASSCLKRSVMQKLRLSGHNAGVCKSRWGHSDNFPAGDYEFLDVIMMSAGEDDGWQQQQQRRLIIDVDFRSHFEIARPTASYASLLQTIPVVYVGFAEKLCLVTDLMCEAAKLSLKKKGLHLPPWRKSGYLKAKWLSAYKRTTNSHCNHRRLPDDDDDDGDLYSPVELAIARNEVQGSDAMARDTTNLPWGSGDRCYGNQVMNHGEHLWPLPAVESNGWQLPAVNPRPAKRQPTQVAGLAAVFMQSGMAVLHDAPETAFQERLAVQAI